MKGNLATDKGNVNIAENVIPSEAFNKLLEWGGI